MQRFRASLRDREDDGRDHMGQPRAADRAPGGSAYDANFRHAGALANRIRGPQRRARPRPDKKKDR